MAEQAVTVFGDEGAPAASDFYAAGIDLLRYQRNRSIAQPGSPDWQSLLLGFGGDLAVPLPSLAAHAPILWDKVSEHDRPDGAVMLDGTELLMLLVARPKIGREAEYDDWYQQIHVYDLLRSPGFVRADRYRWSDPQPAAMPKQWHFMTIYRLQATNAARDMAHLREIMALPTVIWSDAMDKSASTIWEPVAV